MATGEARNGAVKLPNRSEDERVLALDLYLRTRGRANSVTTAEVEAPPDRQEQDQTDRSCVGVPYLPPDNPRAQTLHHASGTPTEDPNEQAVTF